MARKIIEIGRAEKSARLFFCARSMWGDVRVRLVGGVMAVLVFGLGLLCAWFLWKPVHPLAIRPVVDLIIVAKHQHRMQLFSHGRLLRTYTVALGRGGDGAKRRAGDNLVPEGAYLIDSRNPHSAFHLSLHIGYPTRVQADTAARSGLDPGGDVMIHGLRNGLGWLGGWQRRVDWTRGCIAVTDAEMEQIWAMVPDGTPIVITP